MIREGLDRLEQELDGGEYLVGDQFSVADLTAAALLYPLVLPPEAPNAIASVPPTAEPFAEELAARPFYPWVERMYAEYRKPVVEPAAV